MLEWLTLRVGRTAAPIVAGVLILAGVLGSVWLGLSAITSLARSERDAHWRGEISRGNAEAATKQAGKNERAAAAEAEERERGLAEAATQERERALALESELAVLRLEHAAPENDPVFYPAELPKGGAR